MQKLYVDSWLYISPNSCEGEPQEVYRASEVEELLDRMNKTIALFLGPDGEQYVDKFEAAIKSLMDRSSDKATGDK